MTERLRKQLDDAQATVEALQRERDGAYKQGFADALEKVASDWASKEFRGHDEIQGVEVQAFLDSRHVHYEECRGVKPLQTALDAEREKVAELEAAANYYKQPSKNGGVYSVSGGHIGNLMDWCKDNLKHCKFSGPDEDNLDLDLVQTAQQIPQLKADLAQLQALVRALPVVRIDLNGAYHDTLLAQPEDEAVKELLRYRATLDATASATPTHNGGA